MSKAGTDIEAAKEELERQVMRQEFNAVTVKGDAIPDNYDAAIAAILAAGITLDDTADIIVDEWPEIDKQELVNMPFVLANWTLSRSESEVYGTPFLTFRGVTASGRKFRFSDGSFKSGLAAEVMEITTKRLDAGSKTPNAGLIVSSGLTASEYDVEIPDPKDPNKTITIQATTYYIKPASKK